MSALNLQRDGATEESVILLRRICKLLESSSVSDANLRQRTVVENIPSGTIASGAIASGALASGSIAAGAITTGAVASGAYMGNVVMQFGAQATVSTAGLGGIDSRFYMMDTARLAYANGIRSNLSW